MTTSAEVTGLLKTAQDFGQTGLSSWQIEGMLGHHHGRASGRLNGMERNGLVYRVPGISTVVPETGGRASVYALRGRPPTGQYQQPML